MAPRQKLGGFDTDYAKTPGPAGYPVMSPDNFQKKVPAYSMLGRQFMPGGMYYYEVGSSSIQKINDLTS
jgi:hypothetical protein